MKYLMHIAKRIVLFLLLAMPFMALADGIAYDPRISPDRLFSWNEVTENTDDTAVAPPVSYALYLQPGQLEPELIGTFSELTTTFNIESLSNGQYYLHAIAIDGNSFQSERSNVVPFMVVRPVPKPPTGLTIN